MDNYHQQDVELDSNDESIAVRFETCVAIRDWEMCQQFKSYSMHFAFPRPPHAAAKEANPLLSGCSCMEAQPDSNSRYSHPNNSSIRDVRHHTRTTCAQVAPASEEAARNAAAAAEAAAQTEREADRAAMECPCQPISSAEAAAVSAAGSVEVQVDEAVEATEERNDAAAVEKEIKAKEEAVAKAEAATKKAEAKSAAPNAKAAAKEAAALEKAKAEYEKEVVHLTKLAAQKRDDAIEKAGRITTASIIRRKEEASAQSARVKADEKAAKARLSAEKDAWKERQAAEKETHGAFAKAAKLATTEREKAEKAAEAARKAAIKAILAKRDKAFKEAEREKVLFPEGQSQIEVIAGDVGTDRVVVVHDVECGGWRSRRPTGGALARMAVNPPNAPPTLLEWIGSFIWGAKSLAPEVEGAK
ncbi:hypothetical protein B0H13DRAFT_2413982 [Mycena leptocephala]|nr:hypothetical protein B0H13DRAFT_2413982 [Mycena leptocephala]